MAFDPNQPFEIVDGGEAEKTGFDPSQPFELVQGDDLPGKLHTLHETSTDDPVKVARTAALADKAGTTYELAAHDPAAIEKQVTKPDFQAFTATAPKSAEFLAKNPTAFEQLKADIDKLQTVETGRNDSRLLDAAKGGLLPMFSGQMLRKTFFDVMAYSKAEREKAEKDQAVNALMGQHGEQADAEIQRIAALPEEQRAAAYQELTGKPLDGDITSINSRQGIMRAMAENLYSSLPVNQEKADKAAIEKDALIGLSADTQKNIDSMKIKVDPWTPEWFVQEGLGAATQIAESLGVSAITGGYGVAPYYYAKAAGSEYTDPDRANMSEQDRLDTARAFGVSEGAGEAIGTAAVMKALNNTAAPVLKRLLFAAGQEGISEDATTIIQQTYDAIANGRIPDAPQWTKDVGIDERLGQTIALLDQQAQSYVLGAIGGGSPIVVQSAVNKTFDALESKGKQESERQATARRTAATISREIAAISQTKIIKDNPKTLVQALDAMDAGETRELFIDPAQLFQEGVSREAFLQVAPSVTPEQLDEAIRLKTIISVPRNELVVGVAGAKDAAPELEAAIVRHVKADPNQDSQYEATMRMEGLSDELVRMAQDTVERFKTDEAYQADVEKTRQELVDMFNAGMVGDPAGNRTRADLWMARIITGAEDAGMKPSEFKARFMPGNVSNRDLTGDVLNQGAGIESVRQAWIDSGIDGQVFENGDVITLSKIVVPEGNRGAGVGTKAMQMLIDYADANGKHVVLSPSPDFGGNVKRLKKFYKGFGFVENKGKNRADWVRRTGSTGSEEGGRSNFVYFQNEVAPRGAFNPETRDIALFARADLSTFLHETGHLFLEIQVEMAGMENASERVKNDTDVLLQWFKVAGETPQERLAAWNKMTLNEKRGMHEMFAESFEQYLFEGKAPSVELRDAFRTFKAWLRKVYESIELFIVKHKGAKLNDDVRSVFDRMLASEQQIQEATASRNMQQLFTVRPEGVPDAEWDRYVQQARDYVQGSVEQLTARSLRDLKWVKNATGTKGKLLRQMRRDAAAARRESSMEARKHVLSQPVYRAMQFLTAPVEGVTAANRKARQTAEVDPARDTLLTAIAKLGGLNKAEAVSQYGIDAKDFHHKGGVFSKPVLRVEGGLSPDAMAEALSQYGYMPLDENGKWDIRDLDDMLREEAAGNPIYSNQADYDLLLGAPQVAPDKEQVDFMGGRLNRQAVREMFDDIDLQEMGVDPKGLFLQPAYHGSPYKFDKFSLDHMGKGEGAQAYGYGLYFAGSKEVAEYYRKALTVEERYVNGELLDTYKPDHLLASVLSDESGNVEDARDSLAVMAQRGGSASIKSVAQEALKLLEEGARPEVIHIKPDGQLYKVEIPEDGTYLLWDKPLSEQPSTIRDALVDALLKAGKQNEDVRSLTGEDLYKALVESSGVERNGKYYGSANSNAQQYASKFLHSLGINGIKYLDGTSRNQNHAQKEAAVRVAEKRIARLIGTDRNDLLEIWQEKLKQAKEDLDSLKYNYVIFDDSAIQILETYYQNGDDDGNKTSPRLDKMLADDGLHPDVVADLFGIASGEELVRQLLKAADPVAEIERLTDQIMLERYADLATPEAMADAVNAAIHNEARQRMVATELAMLNRAIGKPRMLMAAAKEYAARIVDRTLIKDLKPARFEASEAKAGREADAALRKGQTTEAALAKRNQVLHGETVRQILEAKEEAEKAKAFFAKIATASNKKNVTRGRDPDVVNAITAIVAQYGYTPKKEKTALEYLKLVEQYDPEMAGILKPAVEQAMMDGKPWQEMTVEELRGLRADVESLWYLAKRSRQMEVDGKRLDIEDAAAMLGQRMQEIGVPAEVPGEKSAITPAQSAMRSLQYAGAMLRRVEQWAEAKDGKWGGPFTRLVFGVVKSAADKYRADRAVYRKKYEALIKALPDMKRGTIEAPELGYTFGKGEQKVGMAELLHAILHTGNDSNKRKLLLGRNWATLREDGSLDTGRWDAFIMRLHNEGKLTKAHWDFAQGVWDLLEETKPLAQKTHREVFGRYFDEVAANAFVTPFGVYRGGYVPAQADPRLVQDASLRQLAEQENQNMSYAFPATAKGFTKARVEYNKPLMLDLRSLGQHIDKVLLFSHMEPAVRDVQRLLRRGDVSEPLARIDPTGIDGMIVPWLNRAARQSVETPIVGDGKISRVASVVRNRAGMALMFGNVANTLQQVTGLINPLIKVKGSHMLRAAAQYLTNPKAMTEAVANASPFMRDRIMNEVAAINEQINDILLDPTMYEKGQAWTQKHAYFLQSAFDNVISPIVWTASYNQAVVEGMDDADAKKFADSVVRQTQGSTLPEDVSRIETGPAYARLFTQFVGYFNMMANTSATELQKIAQEVGLRQGAGRAIGVAFYGILAPLWVAEAIALAAKGGPEDDDDDGYLDDWIMQVVGLGTVKGLLAGVPFVGQATMSAINRFNGNPVDDRISMSPAISLLEGGFGAPYSVYKAIADEGDKRKAVMDVATLVSLATGLPARPLARPIGYLTGVADEKIEPTNVVDFTRGVVTGVPSQESKVK